MPEVRERQPLLTLEQARKCHEYAGVLNGEFTVKDVDDGDEANSYIGSFVISISTAGYTKQAVVSTLCSIAASIARRVRPGREMLTGSVRTSAPEEHVHVLKKQGKSVDPPRFDENRPIDLFPKSFAPIESEAKFTGMGEGDGRNGALFKHSAVLLHCGFTPTEVKTMLPHQPVCL